jgi:hypothetical protein
MLQSRELTVALLMEDPNGAREISTSLRQAGIFAHFYRELDEFWVATKSQLPDLAIVDVAKMSLAETKLKDHPCMRDGSLCAAFFYKEETRFLLQSALNLPASGFINGDVPVLPQVLALVQRRQSEVRAQERAKELEERVGKLQTRTSRLMSERNLTEQFKAHFDFLTLLVAEVETESRSGEFTSALFNRLSDWAPVRQVGMYELAPNRQKLVAPLLQRPKWLALPSLWIGKDCADGIEPFAVDMGWQVARDVFENEPVEIRLHGAGKHPDLLVYMDVDRARAVDFPFELMSTMLSGAWRQWRLSRQQPRPLSQALPVWEALDRLDQIHFHQHEGEKVLLLSLAPFLSVIKKKTGNRFHYGPFFNEFFLHLGHRLHETTRFSFCGPWHVLVFAKGPFLEREHDQLAELIASFPFWRFFEDEGRILGEELRPTLKPLAPSAVNYLRTLEREFDELPVMEAQAKLTSQLGRVTVPPPPRA